jgi:hypothetical protein
MHDLHRHHVTAFLHVIFSPSQCSFSTLALFFSTWARELGRRGEGERERMEMEKRERGGKERN